jgi:hypothetical protein
LSGGGDIVQGAEQLAAAAAKAAAPAAEMYERFVAQAKAAAAKVARGIPGVRVGAPRPEGGSAAKPAVDFAALAAKAAAAWAAAYEVHPMWETS